MFKLTRRSLWEHKRRLVSTLVAIMLGVGFMAGTFVLSDTMDRAFDDLFAEGSEKVDAQVQGEVLFSDPFGGMGDQRKLLDACRARRRARRRRRGRGRAVRHHDRLRGHEPRPRQGRRGHRRHPGTAHADRELVRQRQPQRLRPHRGPRARVRRRDRAQRGGRRGGRVRGRRPGHGAHPVRPEDLHAGRPVPVRHRQELGRRHQRRLHARRGPAPRRHRRPDPAGRGQGRGRGSPSRSWSTASARPPGRRRGDHRRRGRRAALQRRAVRLRLLPDLPVDLRRHGPARRACS